MRVTPSENWIACNSCTNSRRLQEVEIAGQYSNTPLLTPFSLRSVMLMGTHLHRALREGQDATDAV